MTDKKNDRRHLVDGVPMSLLRKMQDEANNPPRQPISAIIASYALIAIISGGSTAAYFLHKNINKPIPKDRSATHCPDNNADRFQKPIPTPAPTKDATTVITETCVMTSIDTTLPDYGGGEVSGHEAIKYGLLAEQSLRGKTFTRGTFDCMQSRSGVPNKFWIKHNLKFPSCYIRDATFTGTSHYTHRDRHFNPRANISLDVICKDKRYNMQLRPSPKHI
ncbi:hypothetical protein ACFL0V_04985 [Nanoarchaeota archaeon]